MRNNQPINDNEYIVPNGITLVSKTDLHGTIVECNDAFETASGFTRAELVGQPHNMIRHPDVPSAVFADMWRDLKNGIPWTQIVKNRRKDGGFYWVRAEATPLFEDEKIVGYMSVRSKPTDAEKQSATQAYKDIQSGRLKIKHGQIYSGLDFSILKIFSRMTPTYQLLFLGSVFGLIPILAVEKMGMTSSLSIFTIFGMLLLLLVLYGSYMSKALQRTTSSLKILSNCKSIPREAYYPDSCTGKVMSGLIATNLAILESREEAAYQLDKASQLQLALDKVSSNIMMTDSHYNIIYMNDQLKTFLSERENRLKQEMPNFDMNVIIGSNIDIFHKNPAHNRAMLDKLKNHLEANISIAGYHLQLSIMPINNRSGERVGILVEWSDRTQEVQLLENVQGTVKKAQQGFLSDRIDLANLEGVANDLSLSINDLMDSIEGAMADVGRVTTAMSEGDLTKSITKHYEGDLGILKNAINASISRLNDIVFISIEAARVVDNASQEVSLGASNLSDRVQNQAASLEQTASTMHEMNSAIQNSTKNAQEAREVAIGVQKRAEQGKKVMEQNIEAMNSIQESSHKISDIVSLIDGIAFQTNLLALNAAVEAARAGDHGRGFAVVAGEVRALAQKSAEAARDIKSLIDESVQRIDQGTTLTTESGEVLVEIATEIDDMTKMIAQIAQASAEQATGIAQVHNAINSIDGVTQQNAALVEETMAAAESMSEQAKNLINNMSYFKTHNNQITSNILNNADESSVELEENHTKMLAANQGER